VNKINELIVRLKETWNGLPPEEKRKFAIIAFVIVVSVVGVLAYHSSRGGKKEAPKVAKTSNVTEIGLQPQALERSYYVEAKKEMEELKKEIEELKKAREEQEKLLKEKMEKVEKMEKAPRETAPPPLPPVTRQVTAPPPPPPPSATVSQPGSPAGGVTPPSAPPKPSIQYVGSIQIVAGEKTAGKPGGVQEKKEAKEETGLKKKYYLPPSFMEATLLSGLDAPAVSKGEGHPVPCLFRIKAPAVLPNKVKANLKGCFVIGEGLGNLATERADIRIVNLSCIDKKGRAVIDQKVKGFVVDNDGKIGLRGRVVSKMGSVIARAMLAGFMSGLGNIFDYGAYSYQVSSEGAVYLPKPGEALSAGIAGGIRQATQQIQDFYLELARQTIPVVEILPTRTVTLVVSEGLWLELNEYETYK